MKEPQAPCLNCEERHAGCWTECDKYNKYKKEHAQWADKVKSEKIKEHDMSRMEINRYRK